MTFAPVTPTALRLVRLLVGRDPMSMAELTRATGVTRTAVTEQLESLLGAGYIVRTQQSSGRGRPKHLYAATEDAHRLLYTAQTHRVAPLLLRSVREVCGDQTAGQVLERLARHLADAYRPLVSGVTPSERFQSMARLLENEGVVTELSREGGNWQIRERSCPFVDLAECGPEMCAVERSMLSALVEADVELKDCRLNGCGNCVFELSQPPTDSASSADLVAHL